MRTTFPNFKAINVNWLRKLKGRIIAVSCILWVGMASVAAEPIDPNRLYTYEEARQISKSVPVILYGEKAEKISLIKYIIRGTGLHIVKLPGHPDPNDISLFIKGEEVVFKYNGKRMPSDRMMGQVEKYINAIFELEESAVMIRYWSDAGPLEDGLTAERQKQFTETMIFYVDPATYNSKKARSLSEDAVVLYFGNQNQEYLHEQDHEYILTAREIALENQVTVFFLISNRSGKSLTVYNAGKEVLKYKNAAEVLKDGILLRDVRQVLKNE